MPRKCPPSVAMVIKQRLHMDQLGLLNSKAGPSHVTRAALGLPAPKSVKIMTFAECQPCATWALHPLVAVSQEHPGSQVLRPFPFTGEKLSPCWPPSLSLDSVGPNPRNLGGNRAHATCSPPVSADTQRQVTLRPGGPAGAGEGGQPGPEHREGGGNKHPAWTEVRDARHERFRGETTSYLATSSRMLLL